ncbi:Iron-sulfur cluster carrier protein [Fundidesulfovibrio magnetotacticus]|uniref:Iron-sulfur cluster carrier protein n=1 Tax=Fundidesulfovibrio magnetotacticus TaxID=2730080 RepID=A0A6V8M1F6_9BACT|nr:Mrp/NBP35 family ATP-binding protein [Fundidesulfovibrio magnetotacticus]GFK95786.1 Iron-sulfur cluster carrier protein [Fundidesulfovibrio magnetotacticus]
MKIKKKGEESQSACGSCSKASACSSKGSPSGCADEKTARQNARISTALSRITYKLFVMSGKGGVGKSSVAVNLAAALAAMGNKVGILDVDLHGPSVPRMLGLSGNLEASAMGEVSPKAYGENLFVVSMESLLKDPDQAVLWRGPMKTSAIRQFISDVQWGDLDYLVIDSPPGTGDEHMTVLRTIPDALCVVVTTPQEVSLADVRKAINFLQYAKANILGMVENMSGLICPHCTKEIALFKKGGGEELAKKYGIEFLGAVPLDPVTVVAGDVGRPVVLMDEPSPVKEALKSLAANIDRAAKSSIEAHATLRN